MDQSRVFNDAVAIVRNTLSPESARIIRYSIERQKDEANILHASGFGLAIRNLLAENGIMWEEVILSSIWFAILKEAIKTLLE
ncbi:MAG TPA: hypothetical protein VI758_10570 [Bacteroidota bacterium]